MFTELIDDALKPARAALESGVGRLLVVQTAFLGDVILITPLLRAVRKAFPKAELTAAVIPECREIVEGWCDRIITIDKRKADKATWRGFQQAISALKFQAALLPHRSMRTGRLIRQAGIPIRIGFDLGMGSWFHTKVAEYVPNLYEGKRNLALLKPLTKVEDNGLPELQLNPQHGERVSSILREIGVIDSRFAVISPGSVWRTKAWDIDRYRKLSEILAKNHHIQTLAVGGKADEEACRQSMIEPRFSFAGKLSPLESAWLISQGLFHISGDSAAAHLATAVGAKQIIIFGSTASRFGFAPPTTNARIVGLDLWCRPCTNHGRKSCPIHKTPHCLSHISPEQVIAACDDWL